MMHKHIYYTPLIELLSVKDNDIIVMSGAVQSGDVFETSGFGDNGWE